MGSEKVRMIQLLLFLLPCGTWRTANLGADYCVLFYSNSLSHLKAFFFHFSSNLWSNSLTSSLWMSHLIKRISCFHSPFFHGKVTAEVLFASQFYFTQLYHEMVVIKGLGLLIVWLKVWVSDPAWRLLGLEVQVSVQASVCNLDNERIPVVIMIVSAGYINILFCVVNAVFVGEKSICTNKIIWK